MLGCIQPMSSPMMKRILGLPWAPAAPAMPSTTARVNASTPLVNLLLPFVMPDASGLIVVVPDRRRPLGNPGRRRSNVMRRRSAALNIGQSRWPGALGDTNRSRRIAAHRRHQLMAGTVLRDVGERAGRVAALRQLGVVMNRDEHDPRVRTSREERRRRRDPVETRHHDVRDDHVGTGVVLNSLMPRAACGPRRRRHFGQPSMGACASERRLAYASWPRPFIVPA